MTQIHTSFFWNNHTEFTFIACPSQHFLNPLQLAEASLMLFLLLFLGVRTAYQLKI